jgi:hypothetical protein
MSMNNDLDCRVYIDTDRPLADLATLVAGMLSGTLSGPPFAPIVQTAEVEIEVRSNEDSDPTQAHEFPDGFLYFRRALEIYPKQGVQREARVNLVSRILQLLWSQGLPAVAACDYEAELPHQGGYKERTLPWAPPPPVPSR